MDNPVTFGSLDSTPTLETLKRSAVSRQNGLRVSKENTKKSYNQRRFEHEQEFTTPIAGQDFALVKGNGGLGNYTFHTRRDDSITVILKRGGADAVQLIDEWFEYEYKNRRAQEEYDRVMRYADAREAEWDKKWQRIDLRQQSIEAHGSWQAARPKKGKTSKKPQKNVA